MQYRILGKTGLKVSAVGFGGIPIQRIDARGTRALMERLVEKGVNYIDTARGYTVSESYLGEALSGGLREKFILATKSMSRGYADMARDIGISLSNLRTDYIDLYQLHNIKSDADFELAFSAEGAVAAIQDAIRAGKVGHLGATAHSVDSFERLLSYPEIETIMFPYNIVESQGEALMERVAAQNVGVIAMKPLAGGNITDGTLAMRYILQNKTCTLAIPGMATLEEIEQNTAAAEQDGQTAVLEEYVQGDTLAELLTGAKLTEKEARQVTMQLCQALHVLHSMGAVHRDVKPENVILRGSDAVLIDFDAARIYKDESESDTQVLGTTGFAAPEQYGIFQSDERADIFSLGVLLNIMLTGKHPSREMAAGKMGRIVRKCTMTAPEQRYQSARALMEVL